MATERVYVLSIYGSLVGIYRTREGAESAAKQSVKTIQPEWVQGSTDFHRVYFGEHEGPLFMSREAAEQYAGESGQHPFDIDEVEVQP